MQQCEHQSFFARCRVSHKAVTSEVEVADLANTISEIKYIEFNGQAAVKI